MNSDLPFERGTTYFGDSKDARALSTYDSVKHLLGQTFTVKNNGQGGVGHNQSETELMIVRNGSGFAYPSRTGVTYGGNPHEVSTSPSQGEFGHVSDDAMENHTVQDGDLFYVVVRGVCGLYSQVGDSIVKGEKIGFGNNGDIGAGVSVTGHVIGVAYETKSVGPGQFGLIDLGHPTAIGPLA